MVKNDVFREVRRRLVEEAVGRTFRKHVGRTILINYATVHRYNDSHEVSFDPPILARIKDTADVTRWMDVDVQHLDPYWPVDVLTPDWRANITDTAIKGLDVRLYDVYGMGWNNHGGFDKEPCDEWAFAPEETAS